MTGTDQAIGAEGLTRRDRDIIRETLARYPEVRRATVFGSRAMGTFGRGSDIDLALEGSDLTTRTLARIAADLEDSDLPYKVDLLLRDRRLDPKLEEHIRQHGKPFGWEETTLGKVIELKRGYDLPIQDRRPGPSPIISSSGYTGTHHKAKVSGPGVVTGRYGTIGEVFYVEKDFWPLNTTLYVRDFKGNDPLFISYLLRSLNFQSFNDKSSVPGLNRNDLHRCEVVIPPLAEQRAIAGVLGALNDKIEQNRRTARALERLARAIFRAWFVDFEPVKAKAAGATSFPSMPQPVFDALPIRLVDSEIGPVPERWEVTPLSSVCTLVSGGTPKRSEPSYWGGDIHWYSVKDAPGDGEVWVMNTDERITRDGLANSAARIVPKGCTIISARGTVGKLAMAGTPMAFNQSCYGLLPGDGASFSHLYLLTQTAVADLQQRTHGSVFDTITRATFDGLMVVSQTEVVSSFEMVVAPLFDVLLASLQESAKLADLRDYLLPRLLSGSVRVDHTDG